MATPHKSFYVVDNIKARTLCTYARVYDRTASRRRTCPRLFPEDMDGQRMQNRGEEYHCFERDEWRDAMILDSGNVAAIYRFRGKDICSHIEDCLFILSILEPQLFLERGHANLKAQTSREAKRKICEEQLEERGCIFVPYEEYRYEYGIFVERRSYVPAIDGSRLLKRYVAFAKQCGNRNLDEVIQQFNAGSVSW